MRIGFLSNDIVNQDRLQGMADTFRIDICLLDRRDDLAGIDIGGLLVDLDSWPAEDREDILAFLAHAAYRYPVAVHSYDLDGPDGQALRRRGIPQFRRLSPAVFETLRPQAQPDAA